MIYENGFPLLPACAALVSLTLCAPEVLARNTMNTFPIQDVIELGKAGGQLSDDIALYFGNQTTPPVEATLSRGVVTNKKTNSVNKSDMEACNWTMLSALVALQDRARKDGGNAVINIKSYYKQKVFENRDQYECAGGSLMNGVALIGDVVRLKQGKQAKQEKGKQGKR